MKILVEIKDGIVTNIWCSGSENVEVFLRDLNDARDDPDSDPLLTEPGLEELRSPHFVIY